MKIKISSLVQFLHYSAKYSQPMLLKLVFHYENGQITLLH